MQARVERLRSEGRLPSLAEVDRAVRQIISEDQSELPEGAAASPTLDWPRTAHHLNGAIMALAKDDGPLSAAALVQRLGAAPNALPVLYKLELHLGLAHIALLAAREQLGPSGAGRLAALLESDLSSRFDPNDQAMLAGVISNRLDGYAAAQRNSWVTPSEEFATALFGNVIGRPPRLSDDLNPIYLLHLALIPAVQNFIKRINP